MVASRICSGKYRAADEVRRNPVLASSNAPLMKIMKLLSFGFTLLLASAGLMAGEAETAPQPPSATVAVPRFADSWTQMISRGRLRPAAVSGKRTPSNRVRMRRSSERLKVDRPDTSMAESFVPATVARRAGPAPAAINSAALQAAANPVDFPVQGVSYEGISRLDQYYDMGSGDAPPDTMGAVGYDVFMEVINGSVAIFSKYEGYWLTNAAHPYEHVSLAEFFSYRSPSNGPNYPLEDATDPRVLFDRASGRWFASVMDTVEGGHVILAVSDSEDPMGSWSKYLLELGEVGQETDYPTLGVDRNGVYVAVRIFMETGESYAKIAALEKEPLVSGGSVGVSTFTGLTDMFAVPQPAVNLDAGSADAPSWFVGSSPYTFSGTDSEGLVYRTLVWRGTMGTRTPYLSGATYLATPRFNDPVPARAWGAVVPVDTGDYRLLTAVVRFNQLWTCRNVGVNFRGTSDFADRTACEWLALNLSGARATLAQRGRVFDNVTADPYSFYFPSLAINGQGHVAMAFSGGSGATYVGAYCTGRLRADTANTMRPVTLLRDGDDVYVHTGGDASGRNRWGDYSATTLDPSDDMTFWTIQEYAAAYSTDFNQPIWGTYIAALLAPGPRLNSINARVRQGQRAVSLTLTGERFFDAGAQFPNGLSAEISGGLPNGIENLTATYLSPTQVRLKFDVAADASPGARDLTIFNPDGQGASLTAALVIQPVVNLVVTQSVTSATARVGDPLIWMLRVANNSLTPAANVRLTNTLPPSVSFLGAAPRWLVSKSGGQLIFDLGTLAPGAVAEVPITVLPMLSGRISNRASAGCDAIEAAKADNTSVLLTVVSNAALTGSALAVDDATVREGDAGTANLVFDVLLQPASAATVRVPFATGNGTALAGRDYLPTNGVLVFAPGQTRKKITVRILGDALAEPDETLCLVLTPPVNVLARRTCATGVIRDDDRSKPRVFQNTAAMTIADATTSSGAFLPYPSTILVAGLSAPLGRVSVTLHQFWHTYPEDLDLLLVGPQGQAVMLLSDAGSSFPMSDTSPVTLTFDDTAARLAPETTALTGGSYRPTDYQPGDEFHPPAPAGPFAAALSAFNGTDPNGVWQLFVLDDTASDGGGILGGWSLEITAPASLPGTDLSVKATGPAGAVPATSLSTNELTVLNSGPFTATNAVLTDVLPEGAVFISASPAPTSVAGRVVTFQLGDLPAAGGGSFSIVSSNALAGNFFNVARIASALDDPNPAKNSASNQITVLPLVRITTLDAQAAEPGTDTGRLLITRLGGNRGELLVNYSVAGTAQQGLDFAALSGLAILRDRSNSVVVTIKALNDTAVEIAETAEVALQPGTGFLIDPAADRATVTILDNDPPEISISDGAVLEPVAGTNTAEFLVSLSAPSSRTVAVRFATASGSAVSGKDFVAATGLLTFAPGMTKQIVAVRVLADALTETNEMFSVNLSLPLNGRVVRSRGVGIILTSGSAPLHAAAFADGCRIVSVVKTADGVGVRFTSEVGCRYTLEWSSQPGGGQWQAVKGAIGLAGTGIILEASDNDAGAPQRFYRLAIE